MKIYLASDHAGFALKQELAGFLKEQGHEVEDLGAHTLEENDDYPDYMLPLARRVAGEEGSLGIILGGSGQGEAMAANRVKGARAAVYYGGAGEQTDAEGHTMDMLRSTRAHNNANILSLAARFLSGEDAKKAVIEWLGTPFSGEERHVRRIAKLDAARV